jgi:hypothetical protein
MAMPPIQKKFTTTSTNYDLFADVNVKASMDQYNTTLPVEMRLTFLPDSPCTVIVNGYEYDAPSFYSTDKITQIRSFIIKENGISGLVIITLI